MATIAIVGAGFSGTLLTLHLLRRCCATTRIHLIERNRQFGPGAAYSSGNPSHLLNVPAGKMSAFRDQPTDFVDWLSAQDADSLGIGPVGPGTFVPRQLFGAYMRNMLLDEMRRPCNAGRLKLSRGDVLGVDRSGTGQQLILDRGRTIEADIAVLATGNFPPEPPPGAHEDFLNGPFYRADPWGVATFTGLDPDAPVLLVGTGLTTVDAVITLIDQGHRGPIHALSRRGLLPRRHEAGAAAPPQDYALPTKLGALTRALREASEQALAEGRSWQPVIDQLRPFTQDVWNALSNEDRQRFLRHLRPWWDVHRHRMAPAVADRIEQVRASGQLQIHIGRIQRFDAGTDRVRVSYRRRRNGEQVELDAARVINCAGPGCDYDRITHPLVRSLLDAGLVRPDALRLGLDVTANCALKHADGSISRRLFAIGPVTKAAFWEMTAVPDIRRQCEFLGEFLAAQMGAPVFAVPAPEPAKPRGVRLPAAAARQRGSERLAYAE
ncbi:MAG: FAD/NAD(P)-binding protein [Aliidongia sp.]